MPTRRKKPQTTNDNTLIFYGILAALIAILMGVLIGLVADFVPAIVGGTQGILAPSGVGIISTTLPNTTISINRPSNLTTQNATNQSYAINETYAWKFYSPSNMTQQLGYDAYINGNMNYRIYGWTYSATVSNASNMLTITPMDKGVAPANVLNAQEQRLNWLLTPIGDFYQTHIYWSNDVLDSGYAVYDILQNGGLNVYYAGVSNAVTFKLTSNTNRSLIAVSNSSGVYALGNLMFVKVINGTLTTNNGIATISPSANTIHFMIYGSAMFNNGTFDRLGAFENNIQNHVDVSSGFSLQKSMEVMIPNLGLSEYLAINATTPSSSGVILDNNTIYVVANASQNLNNSWGLTDITFSEPRQSGTVSLRDLYYYFPKYFSTQTFNYYISDNIGTETLWTLGRVTQPYSLAFYPQSDVHLFYFPQTEDDGTELGYLANAVTTNVTIAFQDSNKTLLSTENYHINTALQQTGEGGDSVDVGFRHFLAAGSNKETLVSGNGIKWNNMSSVSGGYYYPKGNAGFNIGTSYSYFTMARTWSGDWSKVANVIAIYGTANEYILGFMKDVSGTTPANSNISVSQVVQLYPNSVVPNAKVANSIYDEFSIPSWVSLSAGMVNLSSNTAMTNSPWDIGIIGGNPTIFTANTLALNRSPSTTTSLSTTSLNTTTSSTSTSTTTSTKKTTTINVCIGTAFSCNTMTTRSTCVAQAGCGWSKSTCSGTADACTTFLTRTSCTKQKGCSWT